LRPATGTSIRPLPGSISIWGGIIRLEGSTVRSLKNDEDRDGVKDRKVEEMTKALRSLELLTVFRWRRFIEGRPVSSTMNYGGGLVWNL